MQIPFEIYDANGGQSLGGTERTGVFVSLLHSTADRSARHHQVLILSTCILSVFRAMSHIIVLS